MNRNKSSEFGKADPQPSPYIDRKLKIEAHGDVWRGRVKPKIRLMGRWLENAGFIPGQHVQVLCVSPGVIELRSQLASGKDEIQSSFAPGGDGAIHATDTCTS